MNEPFTDKPRCKLYIDESGKPKGDGRCCYVKVSPIAQNPMAFNLDTTIFSWSYRYENQTTERMVKMR